MSRHVTHFLNCHRGRKDDLVDQNRVLNVWNPGEEPLMRGDPMCVSDGQPVKV